MSKANTKEQQIDRSSNEDDIPHEDDNPVAVDYLAEQTSQWTRLSFLWPGLAICSTVSAILSFFVALYILAIINAGVFCLSFYLLIISFFRQPMALLSLMIFCFTAFCLYAFYIISLMEDFYECSSSRCASWKLILYQSNYFLIIILAGLLLEATRQSWFIQADYKYLTEERLRPFKKSKDE